MCIVAVIKEGASVSKKRLKEMFRNNPDGAGIGFLDKNKNKIGISKGLFSFKELWEIYKYIKENSKGDVIIHCRIATHGDINTEMCHPFFVNNNLMMAHNGIISDLKLPYIGEYSDTYLFNKYILKELNEGFEYNQAIMRMLEKCIGSYNKIAFLNSRGESFILNKKEWIIDDGVWYSNDSYRTDDDWQQLTIEENKYYGQLTQNLDSY